MGRLIAVFVLAVTVVVVFVIFWLAALQSNSARTRLEVETFIKAQRKSAMQPKVINPREIGEPPDE